MKRSLPALAWPIDAQPALGRRKLAPVGAHVRLGLAAGVLALLAGLAWQGTAGPQDAQPVRPQAAQAPDAAALPAAVPVPVQGPASSIVGALHGTQATLVSLRGLPVQQLPASGARVLFRHRAELRLQGSVVDVTQALALLARGVEPMRLEQVLISSADSGPAMQATVVLTTVNLEPTWFAL